MDFDRLDKNVTNFIKNYQFHVSTLATMSNLSKRIFLEELPDADNSYSRQIDINESIKIVYNFLAEINENMANQFMNIINSKDENNNPYVNILPKDKNPNSNNEVKNGKVYIYYENTPNDPFIILHEMLHKMNECNIINENNKIGVPITRDYFSEAVSITGEMMLGNYMIKNNFITENDLNIRKRKRLNGSKERARDVIVEKELIDLKLQGKKINYENLVNLFSKYDSNSIEYRILSDEKKDLKRINSILNKNNLNLVRSQRYVIAQFLSSELLNRDTLVNDFIKLYYAVGDINSKIMDVYNDIIYSDTIDKII